jgi:hypothetical protein
MGVYCGIYKSSYIISNISYLNSPPPPFSYISPPCIPGIVTTGCIFLFTSMCTQYLHFIHPPTSSPNLSLPLWTPLQITSSACLFSNFVKENKCLFKMATQEVSLWHFHVYIYILYILYYIYNVYYTICIYNIYNIYYKQIGSSFYLSSFHFIPLLMVILRGLKILYSFLCREYINHIHLLNFLLLPFLSHMWLHNIAVFVLGLYSTCDRKYVAFGLLKLG